MIKDPIQALRALVEREAGYQHYNHEQVTLLRRFAKWIGEAERGELPGQRCEDVTDALKEAPSSDLPPSADFKLVIEGGTPLADVLKLVAEQVERTVNHELQRLRQDAAPRVRVVERERGGWLVYRIERGVYEVEKILGMVQPILGGNAYAWALLVNSSIGLKMFDETQGGQGVSFNEAVARLTGEQKAAEP